MLLVVILLSVIGFATLYPLFLWLHAGVGITRSFHRFALGLSLVLAAVAGGGLHAVGDAPGALLAWVWTAWLTLALAWYWSRDRVSEPLLSLPSLLGVALYAHVLAHHAGGLSATAGWWATAAGSGLLGAAVTALTLYATALGHWYLETHGLVPLRFLGRAIRLLAGLLALRLLWSLAWLPLLQPTLRGEPVGLLRYVASLEGFLLPVGLLMGSLAPLVMTGLALGALKERSTTSATGILYAACVCVLLGDVVQRYGFIVSGVVQ